MIFDQSNKKKQGGSKLENIFGTKSGIKEDSMEQFEDFSMNKKALTSGVKAKNQHSVNFDFTADFGTNEKTKGDRSNEKNIFQAS